MHNETIPSRHGKIGQQVKVTLVQFDDKEKGNSEFEMTINVVLNRSSTYL